MIRNVDGDTYRGVPLPRLKTFHQRLLNLSNDEQYTHGTRMLAIEEASYIEDLIAWRALGDYRRGQLKRRRITPWHGNWRAGDDE